jgi:catalase
VADELAQKVSTQTGIAVAPMGTPEAPTPSAPDLAGPLRPQAKDRVSTALSLDKPAPLIKGRKIALLAGDGVDADQLKEMKEALLAQDCVVELIAAHAGVVSDSNGNAQRSIARRRTLLR